MNATNWKVREINVDAKKYAKIFQAYPKMKAQITQGKDLVIAEDDTTISIMNVSRRAYCYRPKVYDKLSGKEVDNGHYEACYRMENNSSVPHSNGKGSLNVLLREMPYNRF